MGIATKQQKNLTVKNGMIKLPEKIQKVWNNAPLILVEYDNKISIEGPSKKRTKMNVDAWKKAAGKLKGKLPSNPVKWQRKIRAEWERDLPW